MASAAVRELVQNLPPSMRESIEGYVDTVHDALPEIQRTAHVKIDDSQVEYFLLVVAIRRIWSAVNNQYWTMHNSIGIAENSSAGISSPENSIRGFKIGRDEITENSAPYQESKRLRRDLEKLLTKLEIKEFVSETSNLNEIAQRMFGQR